MLNIAAPLLAAAAALCCWAFKISFVGFDWPGVAVEKADLRPEFGPKRI